MIITTLPLYLCIVLQFGKANTPCDSQQIELLIKGSYSSLSTSRSSLLPSVETLATTVISEANYGIVLLRDSKAKLRWFDYSNDIIYLSSRSRSDFLFSLLRTHIPIL